MPEYPSEPPQLRPRTSSETGAGVRRSASIDGQHLLDRLDPGAHGAPDAAGLLDDQGGDGLVGGQVEPVEERLGGDHLAAEAEDEQAGDVGVVGVAAQGAPGDLGALAGGHEAAAGVVGEGDDAVDVRVGVQDAAAELVGDEPGGRRGAVHGGDDADVVAGAPAAVAAGVPVEGADGPGGRRQGDAGGAELVGALVVVHAEVVGVHVVADGDVPGGATDGLAVLVHGLAQRRRPARRACARAARSG